MANPSDVEARLAALEARMEQVAADAAAARHLAAARDRDIADLGVKVDANRQVINALGEQTATRFDQLDQRVDQLQNEMRTGFAEQGAQLRDTNTRMRSIEDNLAEVKDLLIRALDRPE